MLVNLHGPTVYFINFVYHRLYRFTYIDLDNDVQE